MTNVNEKRLSFDALAKEYPAHYSAAATEFRRHSVGFAAKAGGGARVLWIGPAGLELSETPVADGRRIPWSDVAEVDVPDVGALPSAASVFALGAWALALDPEDPQIDLEVTLVTGTLVGVTVFGSSTQELRALIGGFRAAHASRV